MYAVEVALVLLQDNTVPVSNPLPDLSPHEAAELLLLAVAFVLKAIFTTLWLVVLAATLILRVILSYIFTGRAPYWLQRIW